MKKLLLIYPPGDPDDSMNNVPPLGLLAISSYIKNNCKGINAPIYNFISNTFDEVESILSDVNPEQVLAVGITVMSSYVSSACQVAQIVRSVFHGVTIFAGGPHITLVGGQFLTRHKEFDALIIGDGEEPIAKLCMSILQNKPWQIEGVIERTTNTTDSTNLQLLPPAQWTNPFNADLEYGFSIPLTYTDNNGVSHPATSLVTSRGCPLACSFCSIRAMNSRYRTLPPRTVLGWLHEERKHNYFEHIYFLDADFLVSKNRALLWSNEITNTFGSNVTWSVQANVGHIISLGPKILKELRSSGLVLAEIGFEAGNDEQLKFFNKTNFGKLANTNQSLIAIKLLKEAGIDIGIDYIMFYPEISLINLAKNLNFLLQGNLVDCFDCGHYFNELILFPGTPLRKYYEYKQGYAFDIDELPDVSKFYQDETVLQIRNIYLNWYKQIYIDKTLPTRRQLLNYCLQETDMSEKSILRLLEIKLRHQPYHILKNLITSGGDKQAAINILEKDAILLNNYFKQ